MKLKNKITVVGILVFTSLLISSSFFIYPSIAFALTPPVLKSIPGITISQAAQVFTNQSALNSINAVEVKQFTNFGGSLKQGEIPSSLIEIVPVNVTNTIGTVKFQYFVEIKEDATPTLVDCSDIRLHVNIDGNDVGVTQWLGYEGRTIPLPLDTGIISITGHISGEQHILKLTPEGRVVGCNVQGYLSAWGGTLVIFKN